LLDPGASLVALQDVETTPSSRIIIARQTDEPTPGLRYAEDPDLSRDPSGSSAYLRPGVGGVTTVRICIV
jgi:hypothetical protein